MVDRLLLFLLLLLLPIGVLASRFMAGEISLGNSTSSLTEKKLEKVVEQLQAQLVNGSKPIQPEFNITGVVYASESGTLKIGVVPPNPDKPIWVWVAAQKKNAKKDATGSADPIQGEGPWVYDPKVGTVELATKDYLGIVSVQLQQDDVSYGLRYDLEQKKEVN